MAKVRMPSDLRTAGQELWKSIIDRDPPYELRPDEYQILMEACREADMIALLDRALGEDLNRLLEDEDVSSALTTKGSMGQRVISPFIQEVRQHRQTLMALLKTLKLPDAKSPSARQTRDESGQSTAARAAARSRWSTKGA